MASCAVCLDACLGKCAVRDFTSRACATDLRIVTHSRARVMNTSTATRSTTEVALETFERRASTED